MGLASRYIILFYNLAQFLGWALILFGVLKSVLQQNYLVLNDPSVFQMLKIVQAMQYLDVVFGLVGMSTTKVVPSLTQVTGRNSVVWFVFPHAFHSIYPCLTIVCWALADLIRYATYLNNSLKLSLGFINHLRYNAFILLYPAGLTGEFMSAGDAKTFLEAQGKSPNLSLGGVEVPINNIQFLQAFRILAYPGLAFMYVHMWKLRARFYKKENEKAGKEQ